MSSLSGFVVVVVAGFNICSRNEVLNMSSIGLNAQNWPLGYFLCIRTPNTGQLNLLFHTFAEFRPIVVNRVVARQSTYRLAANAHFSPNDYSQN